MFGRWRIKQTDQIQTKNVSKSLSDNMIYIQKSFNQSSDLKTRSFQFIKQEGLLVYLETVCDLEKIQTNVLVPISKLTGNNTTIDKLITSTRLESSNDLDYSIDQMLRGYCLLFMEDNENAFIFNASKINSRSPDEPSNEKVVRGSHSGFVENLDTNLNLIRTRLANRQLTIEYMEIGTESNTRTAVVYMKGLANEQVLSCLKERMQSISSDMLFSPGYLEEFIEDEPFSPFPQTLYSERPDRVMAHLMDGKIAIFTDGSSDVVIAPVTLFSFFQSPDDYNSRVYAGSFFRLIRFVSFIVALTFPALYIAIVAFHFEVIPNEIVVLVKHSVESVPFPPLIEAMIMAFTIELIREAGVRLPTPIGSTIGIVGGLIIGDAVINAGLISNMMVIIIAITAVSSFTVPSYEMSTSIRLLTFPLMVSAASLGFLGMAFSLMFIIGHLCKLESFGTPYFATLAPLTIRDLKDSFVRFPVWMFNRRPQETRAKNMQKQGRNREWDDEE
ncbi:spore germination protein [Fictibacillus phosphorivorans]|nr:spore germination protein [Fictibacillus phosphorivorans]